MTGQSLTYDWCIRSFVGVISNNALFREQYMNIYVGNLPWAISDDELRNLFADFGEVASASVIMDKFSGRSKGFGFVEMPNNSEAEAAIKAMNEKEMKGRNLRVNEAKPREDRPQRSRH
jgi:RNA recognition motif-containing protein